VVKSWLPAKRPKHRWQVKYKLFGFHFCWHLIWTQLMPVDSAGLY